MGMFSKLLKCFVVASVIAPAGISPAVAGCCGGVNGKEAGLYYSSNTYVTNSVSESYTTENSVTNTSMQMVVTEGAQWTQPISAPTSTPSDPSGAGSCEEVM